MGDIINIGDVIGERDREDRQRMENALQGLIQRVREGELVGILFVAIPTNRQSLSIGLLKANGCGIHEMVGASTMLNDYLRDASQDNSET